MKRKELLALPKRAWDDESFYDSVLIIPSGRKHDSGYMLIAIVGVIKGEPKEIAAYCDDIHWIAPAPVTFGSGFQVGDLRTDMFYPSGIMQMWGRGQFKVGLSLSSTDITFIRS